MGRRNRRIRARRGRWGEEYENKRQEWELGRGRGKWGRSRRIRARTGTWGEGERGSMP